MRYMRYQKFIENVKEHMQKELQQKVHVYPILKNNGTIYDGLVIIDPILNISPTIYLNPYYHRYLDGVSMEDIYEDILETYRENCPQEDFDISIFTDYEKAQKSIVMKLVNAEKNKELLETVPHILYLDLAIIFLCSVSDFMNEYATILIHNHHMAHWEVSTEDLYERAKVNTPQILPPRLDNLHDVFEYITHETLPFLEELNISILTNKIKVHGATCMVYPDLLEEIAEIYEDNLIIIPSSIHEVLVIPEANVKKEHSLQDFNPMIQEVNETQLTDGETLSDHAYLYHRDTKEITY